MGAAPIGVLVTLLLPSRNAVGHLETIMGDVHAACADLGVAVLGGHTGKIRVFLKRLPRVVAGAIQVGDESADNEKAMEVCSFHG